MSRLDYITIGIVAACILAIIFLVYKMTDLFGGDTNTDLIENTSKKVEEENDSTYNYNIDEGDEGLGESTTDNATTTTASTDNKLNNTATPSNNIVDKEEEARTPSPVEKPVTKAPARSQSSGKFMVIAGTYAQKSSAQRQLKTLRSLGYNNAAIESFDRGKYDVVLVDRFDNMAAAERLVKDLKAEGIASYVKAKEGN